MSYILSVDIGIKNLGFVFLEYDALTFTVIKVIDVCVIDISTMYHRKIHKRKCTLHHDACISDWLDHVYQEYDYFTRADLIILERQPIYGIQAVEQLLVNKYRDKVILIHPIKMHIFYGINNYDYETRKKHAVTITEYYLKNELVCDAELIDKFNNYTRRHDIADALCNLMYYIITNQRRTKLELNLQKIHNTAKTGEISINAWFEQFRYRAI